MNISISATGTLSNVSKKGSTYSFDFSLDAKAKDRDGNEFTMIIPCTYYTKANLPVEKLNGQHVQLNVSLRPANTKLGMSGEVLGLSAVGKNAFVSNIFVTAKIVKPGEKITVKEYGNGKGQLLSFRCGISRKFEGEEYDPEFEWGNVMVKCTFFNNFVEAVEKSLERHFEKPSDNKDADKLIVSFVSSFTPSYWEDADSWSFETIVNFASFTTDTFFAKDGESSGGIEPTGIDSSVDFDLGSYGDEEPPF